MKLDEGEDVAICSERDDVLLTTAEGQCIRFPVTDVRVFKGRDSMGVRGISLSNGDASSRSPSCAIWRLLPRSAPAISGCAAPSPGETAEEGAPRPTPRSRSPTAPCRRSAMSRCRAEQVMLTISVNGYGKRTSSFEYRVTGRGGKGIVAMAVNERNGELIASFPVEDSDQIMLVTDGGQLIRCPVEGIRMTGRSAQGVIIFDTAKDEKVVSVERISEDESDNGEEAGEGEGASE
jgi:DNA gyrase subunit A